MSNLMIANVLLTISILCMVACVSAGMPLMFLYSTAATALAGAVRHQQLPHDKKAGRRD
jgi:K+-transporting ATPase A subunit